MKHRMAQLEQRLGETLDRLAQLETRHAQTNHIGRVKERDHEKGVRIVLHEPDGEEFLSPWIQPSDRSGVGRYLPDVGEQVMISSMGGEHQLSTVVPLTHSDERKNPAADKDETVFYNRNGVRHSEKGGHVVIHAKSLTLQSGKNRYVLNGQGHQLVQSGEQGDSKIGTVGYVPQGDLYAAQPVASGDNAHTITGAGHSLTKTDQKSLTIGDAGHAFKGGAVKHEAKNIGASHTHKGVQQGAGNTQDPNDAS